MLVELLRMVMCGGGSARVDDDCEGISSCEIGIACVAVSFCGDVTNVVGVQEMLIHVKVLFVSGGVAFVENVFVEGANELRHSVVKVKMISRVIE